MTIVWNKFVYQIEAGSPLPSIRTPPHSPPSTSTRIRHLGVTLSATVQPYAAVLLTRSLRQSNTSNSI
jgi:hypothetical protein